MCILKSFKNSRKLDFNALLKGNCVKYTVNLKLIYLLFI